jgi:DNA ligase-1
MEHLKEVLLATTKAGGEGILNIQCMTSLPGLMMRKPKSPYVFGRSNTLLKVKTFHDEDARIIGYKTGEGRLTNMMGGLICEMPNGKFIYCSV